MPGQVTIDSTLPMSSPLTIPEVYVRGRAEPFPLARACRVAGRYRPRLGRQDEGGHSPARRTEGRLLPEMPEMAQQAVWGRAACREARPRGALVSRLAGNSPAPDSWSNARAFLTSWICRLEGRLVPLGNRV